MNIDKNSASLSVTVNTVTVIHLATPESVPLTAKAVLDFSDSLRQLIELGAITEQQRIMTCVTNGYGNLTMTNSMTDIKEGIDSLSHKCSECNCASVDPIPPPVLRPKARTQAARVLYNEETISKETATCWSESEPE